MGEGEEEILLILVIFVKANTSSGYSYSAEWMLMFLQTIHKEQIFFERLGWPILISFSFAFCKIRVIAFRNEAEIR